jgi:hypothetical protein
MSESWVAEYSRVVVEIFLLLLCSNERAIDGRLPLTILAGEETNPRQDLRTVHVERIMTMKQSFRCNEKEEDMLTKWSN